MWNLTLELWLATDFQVFQVNSQCLFMRRKWDTLGQLWGMAGQLLQVATPGSWCMGAGHPLREGTQRTLWLRKEQTTSKPARQSLQTAGKWRLNSTSATKVAKKQKVLKTFENKFPQDFWKQLVCNQQNESFVKEQVTRDTYQKAKKVKAGLVSPRLSETQKAKCIWLTGPGP